MNPIFILFIMRSLIRWINTYHQRCAGFLGVFGSLIPAFVVLDDFFD